MKKMEENTENTKNADETGISSHEFHTMEDWTEEIFIKFHANPQTRSIILYIKPVFDAFLSLK